ncbi:MAG: PEP-CTERM sorting domain-containing protein [Phycisphaeraceae bacterium]
MRRFMSVAAALALTLVAADVQATVLFEENIDNMSLGPVPAGSTTTGNGSWTPGTSGGTVDVVTDPTSAGRGQVIEFDDSSASGVTRLQAHLEQTSTDELLLTYDIYNPGDDANGSFINEAVRLYSSTFLVSVYTLWNNNELKVYSNARTGLQARTVADSLTTDRWYRMELIVPDLVGQNLNVAETYAMKLTDLSTGDVVFAGDDLQFYDSQAANYNEYRFDQTGNDFIQRTYHDNFLITTEIPEPATLGLLGLGLGTLLCRRSCSRQAVAG